jgi:hypothetical protein
MGTGRPRVAVSFTFAGGKIVAMHQVADQERLSRLEVMLLDD